MITVSIPDREARVGDGPPIHVPGQEATLLHALVAARGRTVETDTLCAWLWPMAEEPENARRSISVVICKLRQKLGRDAIQNVWGSGYRINPDLLKETR
jgi:DNA-binding response OmpR family regulator